MFQSTWQGKVQQHTEEIQLQGVSNTMVHHFHTSFPLS